MASYALATSYIGDALISGFNWINTTDPTGGFVAYQSQQDALAKGLYSVDGITQAVTLRVDTTNVYPANGSEGGRPSIRIESKLPVNKGLVIGDFAHMPGSVCGSWPAYWMYGPDWPNNGEVDIIEGANTALKNLMSGHTLEGCTLPSSGFTGVQSTTDCTSPGDNGDIGCGYVAPSNDTHSYGDDFNSIGGGVYALQWTDAAIKIWHFPRTAIPADITNKQPNPSTWGEPEALFGGSTCDVDNFFNDMSIVLNMDFCGAYAGNVWGVADNCAVATNSTCVDFVANNPSAFQNVYWEVNYIDVYDAVAANTTTSSQPSSSPTRSVNSTGIYSNTSSTQPYSTQPGSTAPATTGVPISTPTASLTRDPASIGDFVLLGCFGSNSSFPDFSSAGTNSGMTPDMCVGLCANSKYAGIYDDTCYCANVLDATSTALPDIDMCDQPCPGDASQYCGGLKSGGSSTSSRRHLARRAVASPNILLTVYANPDASSNPPPAPAMGNPSTLTVTATVQHMTTVTSTMTYATVCPTNPASLVLYEFCATFVVPDCGCATQTYPEIPCTTVVTSCNACGPSGESNVTLTVPAAVAAASATAHAVAVASASAGAGAAFYASAAASAAAYASAAATGAAAAATAAATAAANVSTVSTTAPASVVTAAAGVAAMSKELLALMVAGSCALYFAVLL